MSAERVVIDHEANGYVNWFVLAAKIEHGHAECERSACCFRMVADSIREQNKVPKPDEPTGLGAVVEDTAGVRWYRTSNCVTTSDDETPMAVWKKDNTNRVQTNFATSYTAIDVARVLSGGVA